MYFIAIVCPRDIDEKILQFKNYMKDQFGCVQALKSPAHITLIPPFWMEYESENELINATNSFERVTFKISLDGFSHFGKRTIFVHVVQGTELSHQKMVVENHFTAAFKNTIKKDERPFHPHITIANRDMKPGDFLKAWEYFSTKYFNEEFQYEKISLLKLVEGKWRIIQ